MEDATSGVTHPRFGSTAAEPIVVELQVTIPDVRLASQIPSP